MSLRTFYLILFVISLGMVGYNLLRSRRIKNEVSLRMNVLMGAFIVEATACLVTAFVRNERTASLAFSFAYIATDIMLLYMYVLIRYFVKQPFTSKLRLGILFSLITVDCLSMILNHFFNHAFKVYEMKRCGEYFFQAEFLSGMYIRLGILYLYCILIVYALLKRIFSLPRIYMRRYSFVLLFLILMLLWDSLYSILKLPINTGILANGIFSFIIYYCALGYIPKAVFTNIFMKAVDEDRDGLMFYDADDECIFVNDSLGRLTGLGKDKEQLTKRLLRLVSEKRFVLDENSSRLLTLVRNGQALHLQTEVQALSDRSGRKIGNLIRVQDMTGEKNEEERKRYLLTHDTLTNAYSRQGFYQTARELIDNDPSRKRLILRFNYRDFKYVNNYFGLKKGDEILCKTVTMLNEITGRESILARFYGDDFVMLIDEEEYNEEKFTELLERLSHNIVDTYYTIYTHMGVYAIDDPQMEVSQMCDYASLAVDRIKSDRGNRISHYSGDIMEQQLHEKDIIGRFEDALKNGEFQIYLQPQVTPEGKLLSAEALARWIDPEKGMVMPGDFIPVLERNGLIYKLDHYVWEAAAQLLADWNGRDVGRDIAISVNVSPKDIYYLNLDEIFADFVRKNQIDASLLKIEMTETTIMRDRKRYTELIDSLHAKGFEIEMDDFGSGYSSLGILQDIPVDVLKIDRSFIQEAESNDRSRIILGMVMNMAKNLNMKVVVEGVETKDQVYFLEALGCQIFQGYYFAKPMSVADFEEKYYRVKK